MEELSHASTTSAETEKTPAGAQSTDTSSATDGNPKTYTQADIDRIIKDRLEHERKRTETKLERERADAAAKAAADAGDHKTLAEQAQARVAELEAQIAARDAAALRAKVAAAHQLPADLADRLRGATEEELIADAKALAKLIPPPAAGADSNPGRTGSTPSLLDQTNAYYDRTRGRVGPGGAIRL